MKGPGASRRARGDGDGLVELRAHVAGRVASAAVLMASEGIPAAGCGSAVAFAVISSFGRTVRPRGRRPGRAAGDRGHRRRRRTLPGIPVVLVDDRLGTMYTWSLTLPVVPVGQTQTGGET